MKYTILNKMNEKCLQLAYELGSEYLAEAIENGNDNQIAEYLEMLEECKQVMAREK